LQYWPNTTVAHCNATAEGDSGVYAPIREGWCYSDDPAFVTGELWWYWNQSWPTEDYDLTVYSAYLINAVPQLCVECWEVGTHTISKADLEGTWAQVVYGGRSHFAIRPTTMHE
jgi:hypothetical protein